MQSEIDKELLEAAVNNGRSMLKDLNFLEEIEVLGFRFFDLYKKSRIVKEYKALHLALWHFALVRSFPNNHNEIYENLLNSDWFWKKSEKDYIVSYAAHYFEKLHERGVDDFTLIARHILSFCNFDEAKEKASTLKLALLLRSNYTFFFNHLL